MSYLTLKRTKLLLMAILLIGVSCKKLPTAPISQIAAQDSSCHCKSVRVHCFGSGRVGAAATCSSVLCQVFLPKSMCEQGDYHEGEVVDPESIFGGLPELTDANQISNFCALRHEMKHACDQPGSIRACHSEVIAFNASLDCLRQYYRQICEVEVIANDGVWQTCARISSSIDQNAAGREVNLCKCRGSNWEECAAECRTRHDHQICTNLVNLYFPW